MRGLLFWTTALIVSLGAHTALFAFLTLATDPEPLNAKPAQKGKIRMTSYEVSQSKARLQDTKGEAQDAREVQGQALGQGPVQSETAAAMALPQNVQPAQTPPSERPSVRLPDNTAIAEIRNETVIEAQSAFGAPAPALRAKGPQAKAAPPSGETLPRIAPPPATAASALQGVALSARLAAQPAQAARAPSTASLAASALAAVPAAATPMPAAVLTSASIQTPALGATAPNPGLVPAASLITEISVRISADGTETVAKAPPARPAPSRAPDAPLAKQPPLNAPAISAATGWSGNTAFDPASLAAIQSFMQPLDASQQADSPRDAISQLLASVPCARLAATFIPETGTLELRGHIPDEAVRGPILTAIRQQLGESIPVGGSMIVLPSPQCNVLSALENIGLPQSQGQTRDPMQIGAITQIASFDFAEGERVIIKMRSPDFPAYVYVDFFDVAGRVLHLRPNRWEPVEQHPPDTPLEIGGDREGRESVKLVVRPPFGQELAVAYASSEPLYQGLRETIEPAGPYLEFLRSRIAQLRAENPDYKGEWVYMVVQTSP